jgi:glycosyltransferase involved in cell wall biosynthesis
MNQKKIRYSQRSSPVFAVARAIKRGYVEIVKGIKDRNLAEKKVVYLQPQEPAKGKVLISYILDGFLLDPDAAVPKTHTNIWMSVQMAEIFLDLGYAVEAIHFTNRSFLPQGNYTFFLDVRHNLQRLTPLLNSDCIKIMHIDSAHMLFHNFAEASRLLALQQRQSITLFPRRFEIPNLGIEHADYATTCGNDFTIDTFRYAKKKIFKLPSPCGIQVNWPERKYDKIKQNFIWFSSSGSVHKGLDLALDAFKDLPDYQLTVCGPVERDADFVHAYYKELFETANIHTVGWVDLDSDRFRELTAACVAVLHLSCSEGGAPSVKMCMHAGLIPIVSWETGVDVEDFGFILKACSIAEIQTTLAQVASLSNAVLAEKGRQAWEYARRFHTRENFSKEFRKVIKKILESSPTQNHKDNR